MQEIKNNNPGFSLESAEFIFRHPWLVIFPAIILMSAAFSYVFSSSPLYKTAAVISFEAPSATAVTKPSISKNELLSRILLGENIRDIIKDVWPQADEETSPVLYDRLIETLRNKVAMIADRQDARLLNISFTDLNPNICYKVVRSVVDTIIKENTRVNTEQLEASLSFLKKQVDFYKGKLKDITQEKSGIRNKLLETYSFLDDSGRNLIREALGKDFEKGVGPDLQKFIKYDTELAQLSLQLQDAQAKKEALQGRLKGIAPKPASLTAKDFEEDDVIKRYSKAIEDKELAITNLLSQDFALEHPQVVKLQNEVDSLKMLVERRIKELSESGHATGTKAQTELEKIELSIETLKNKIDSTQKYIKDYKEQFKGPKVNIETFADDIAKFKDLKSSEEIATNNYTNFRKQLEEAELKIRVEIEKFGVNIKIIEEPRVPIQPIPFQRLSRIFMGLIFALGSGVGLAYLADSLINSIKSSAELRGLLQIPVLGSIDRITTPEEMKSLRARRKRLLYILIGLSLASWILVKLFIFIFKR